MTSSWVVRWVPAEGDTEGMFYWIKTGKGTEAEGTAYVKRSKPALRAGMFHFIIDKRTEIGQRGGRSKPEDKP